MTSVTRTHHPRRGDRVRFDNGDEGVVAGECTGPPLRDADGGVAFVPVVVDGRDVLVAGEHVIDWREPDTVDPHQTRMLDGGDAVFGRTDDGYDDPRDYA